MGLFFSTMEASHARVSTPRNRSVRSLSEIHGWYNQSSAMTLSSSIFLRWIPEAGGIFRGQQAVYIMCSRPSPELMSTFFRLRTYDSPHDHRTERQARFTQTEHRLYQSCGMPLRYQRSMESCPYIVYTYVVGLLSRGFAGQESRDRLRA